MERFSFIFLVAGLGFFVLAFVLSAWMPTLPVADVDVQSIEDLTARPPASFLDLKAQYPEAFQRAFQDVRPSAALETLMQQHPEAFEQAFSLTDEAALERLQQGHPDLFAEVFFEDAEVEDALEELEEDRDAVLQRVREADEAAYEQTFQTTVASALAALEADYDLAMHRIRKADPAAHQAIFQPRSDAETFRQALVAGHRIYIGDGCWHCHSQQVRPWGRDEARYGQISYPEEYHNAMNMPPLWGTRRVGPDLIRRGDEHANDWHVAHFYSPRHTSPASVMPDYPWFYEEDGRTPNEKGLAIIAYVRWLGSWQDSRRETVHQVGDIERSYAAPGAAADVAE